MSEPTMRVNVRIDSFAEMLAKIERLKNEVKNCRNELCLKCGNYHEAHNGACDDCRYRHGGEWSVDLDE